jgi:hypothetical protein
VARVAQGYYRAGFDVVGIDNKPHKDYPFMMIVVMTMPDPTRRQES